MQNFMFTPTLLLGLGPSIPACQNNFESWYYHLSFLLYAPILCFQYINKGDFYIFIQVLIKILNKTRLTMESCGLALVTFFQAGKKPANDTLRACLFNELVLPHYTIT